MEEKPFFSPEVKVTRIFCEYWLKLTPEQQKIARKKIALLVENYRHSSLKTHPIHRCPGKWECSLSKTKRLVYARSKDGQCQYILYAVGGHDVVDSASRRRCYDDPDLEREVKEQRCVARLCYTSPP